MGHSRARAVPCTRSSVLSRRRCVPFRLSSTPYYSCAFAHFSCADGALLVYDITDEASFVRVKEWVKELRKMLSDDLQIAITGNKCDMEKSRHVDKDEVLAYCASVGATHHLTSAKTGAGVNEAFTELMRSTCMSEESCVSNMRFLLNRIFACRSC